MILAGDIGGTNTRLALFNTARIEAAAPGQLVPDVSRVYPSRSFPDLTGIIEQFLHDHPAQIHSCCLGVAGPVDGNISRATNLPWLIDATALAAQFGFAHISLINDLLANAHGIRALSPDDLLTVNPGRRDPAGNCAVISAGTGLGEAGMFWDGSRYIPFATEGGHCDFGPRNELQFALARHLQDTLGHVSYETVLSGSGLEHLYDFIVGEDTAEKEPSWLLARFEEMGKAAAISATAVGGEHLACSRALDLYLEIYGQEAGNLALKTLARGGIFLGGGIAAKLATTIQQSEGFKRGFCNKEKMAALMESIPIRVILNDDTALLGAALVAAGALGLNTPSSLP